MADWQRIIFHRFPHAYSVRNKRYMQKQSYKCPQTYDLRAYVEIRNLCYTHLPIGKYLQSFGLQGSVAREILGYYYHLHFGECDVGDIANFTN